MITTFNLFTCVSWIATGVISAIVSGLFLTKNPRKRLNQFFSAGFIFWSFSMIFNGINFAVAYSSLFVANLFRDLTVFFGLFSASTLLIAAFGIYFGVEKLNWILILLTVIGTVALATVGCFNDWVTSDGFGGFKTTDNLIGLICIQIVSAFLVVLANFFLILTFASTENKIAKKRVGFFVIGYSTIILGLLMFLLDSILESFINITPYLFPSLGLVVWVLGPILMLVGFYTKNPKISTTFPEKPFGNKPLLNTEKYEQKIDRPS